MAPPHSSSCWVLGSTDSWNQPVQIRTQFCHLVAKWQWKTLLKFSESQGTDPPTPAPRLLIGSVREWMTRDKVKEARWWPTGNTPEVGGMTVSYQLPPQGSWTGTIAGSQRRELGREDRGSDDSTQLPKQVNRRLKWTHHRALTCFPTVLSRVGWEAEGNTVLKMTGQLWVQEWTLSPGLALPLRQTCWVVQQILAWA